MKRSSWLPTIAILLLISTAILGCSNASPAAPKASTAGSPAASAPAASAPATSAKPDTAKASGEPIKIGVIESQNIQYGPNYVTMLKVKAKQINEAGGVKGRPIELLFEDSAMDVSKATSAARRLAEQGVVALIGDNISATSLALSEVAAELKIPHIGDGAATGLTQPVKPWTFALTPNSDTMAKAYIGRSAQAGHKKVGYFYTDSGSGPELIPLLTKYAAQAGIEVVEKQSTTLNQNDVMVQATKLKASGATSIMIQNNPTEIAALYRAFDALGWKPHTIGAAGSMGGLGKTVGPSYEGTEIADWWIADNNPSVQAIQKAVLAADPKYNLDLSMPYLAWDDLMIVVDAMKRAKTIDRAAIRDAMESTKDLPAEAVGPPGWKFTFSPQSHYGGPDMPIKVWKGGAWVAAK